MAATLAFVGGSIALPRTASALPPSPLIYCVPGVPSACFAADMVTSTASATFWIQNLQGSLSPDETPFPIRHIRVARKPGAEWLAWGVADWSTSGPVGDSDWSGMAEESIGADEGDPYQHRSYHTIGMGIYGCDRLGSGEEPPIGLRTCVREGQDGWFRIDFAAYLRDPDELGGAYVRAIDRAEVDIFVGSEFSGEGCVIRGALSGLSDGELGAPSCTVRPYSDLVVTPEPVTVALLASGMLILGGTGMVRRRRAA